MEAKRRIAKNTTVYLLAQIIGYIFTFFVILFAARYLGAEGYGILSIAISLSAIFGIFTDLGLGILTVREISRDKSLTDKYIGNILLIKIILAILTFGLTILTVRIIGYSQEVITVVFIITISIIFGIFFPDIL